MAGVNVGAYIGIVYFVLIFCCIAIVFYYAEPGFPWHTYLTLIIGYYVSFGILFLVPIDIAAVVIDRRSSTNYWDPSTSSCDFSGTIYASNLNVLNPAYSTFFTTIVIFGSFLLVFEEYYNTNGQFENV